jgi:esterase
MPERFVEANGLTLWTEHFGDPADSTILLLMGGTAQSIMWPVGFIEGLRDGGRFVIRYDHRDTGRSETVDFAECPYTMADLAADAVGVLDAYGIDAAHMVGSSMGGMIAQQVALDFPTRVRSVTSIASSPGGAGVPLALEGESAPDALPPPNDDVVRAGIAVRDATTRDERVAARVELYRSIAGSIEPFDAETTRGLLEWAEDRQPNPGSELNHALAVVASPDRSAELPWITAPTLVIHGLADPVFPIDHGRATARLIPGADLVEIESMGHSVPRTRHQTITDAILEHTARAG